MLQKVSKEIIETEQNIILSSMPHFKGAAKSKTTAVSIICRSNMSSEKPSCTNGGGGGMTPNSFLNITLLRMNQN